MSINNPIPPLSNQITDSTVSLIWSSYFSNLKNYLDDLATAATTKLHNALDSIQGGSITERYHLTLLEWQNAIQLPTFNGDTNQVVNGAGGLSFVFHNDTVGIQGGDIGEYYHLTAEQIAGLGDLPVYGTDNTIFLDGTGAFSIPLHNNATDLQGGAADDYQHLTTVQLNSINGIQSKIFGYMTLGL
jgi:hypothetical protein